MQTVYEILGRQWFDDLVDRFYDSVENDPILRPMYPEDLAEPRARLAGFLVQFWGGPTDYSDARGHPRLRMRHVPFPIGQGERDAWFGHMSEALAGAHELPAVIREEMITYFDRAATAMMNR